MTAKKGILSIEQIIQPGLFLFSLLNSLDITVAPYLGYVATRTGIPDTLISLANSRMQRFGTFARDDLTSISIAWPNWYGDELTPNTNVMTYKASVEYPAGTFTQVKFSSSATGTSAPGTTLWSDFTAVNIPNGALFWIRFFQTGSTAYLANSVALPNATIGDALHTTSATDQTMSGTVVGDTNGLLTPCAIIGTTTKRTICIIGDSRQAGAGDGFQAANGAYGQISHALNQYGYTNLGLGGHTAAQYLAAHTLRDQLVSYATDVIDANGTNDIFVNTVSAATLEATKASIRALYLSKRYWLTTIDPETTSTDSFATLVNQAVRANEAARVTYNTDVRANALGFSGQFDVAALSESSLNSGKWKVDGTAFKYTVDGTHLSPAAYALLDAAGFALP